MTWTQDISREPSRTCCRTPFRPFTVALGNGDHFQVDHPQALVLRGGVAVFITADGVPTLFDHESVSQFVGEPLGQPTT